MSVSFVGSCGYESLKATSLVQSSSGALSHGISLPTPPSTEGTFVAQTLPPLTSSHYSSTFSTQPIPPAPSSSPTSPVVTALNATTASSSCEPSCPHCCCHWRVVPVPSRPHSQPPLPLRLWCDYSARDCTAGQAVVEGSRWRERQWQQCSDIGGGTTWGGKDDGGT